MHKQSLPEEDECTQASTDSVAKDGFFQVHEERNGPKTFHFHDITSNGTKLN